MEGPVRTEPADRVRSVEHLPGPPPACGDSLPWMPFTAASGMQSMHAPQMRERIPHGGCWGVRVGFVLLVLR